MLLPAGVLPVTGHRDSLGPPEAPLRKKLLGFVLAGRRRQGMAQRKKDVR